MAEEKKKGLSALERQVGGNHYQHYKIQPYEFFIKNKIPHHKAAIIRRILRYDHPTGRGLEDLEKIKHEIDLIIELEHWEVAGEWTLLDQVHYEKLHGIKKDYDKEAERERTEEIKKNWQAAGRDITKKVIERANRTLEESDEEEEEKGCSGYCRSCGNPGLGIYEKK